MAKEERKRLREEKRQRKHSKKCAKKEEYQCNQMRWLKQQCLKNHKSPKNRAKIIRCWNKLEKHRLETEKRELQMKQAQMKFMDPLKSTLASESYMSMKGEVFLSLFN